MEDFETRLQEYAKKYQSDWHHHRFAYSKDYTPESAFVAGARFGRAETIREVIELLRNGKLESAAEVIGLNWQWADWLEEKLK